MTNEELADWQAYGIQLREMSEGVREIDLQVLAFVSGALMGLAERVHALEKKP